MHNPGAKVADPRSQIKDLESLAPPGGGAALSGANFGIGVWVGTRYARAGLISVASGVRTYQLAVPTTAVARVYLDTSLKVLDSTAATLSVHQAGVTLAAAGQSQVTVNLTVP